MLTFNIVTNEKNDTFYFAENVIEHMGYVGPQQKVLLQRKQLKEIIKPGYFSAYINIPTEETSKKLTIDFIKKVQNIIESPASATLKVSFFYETENGKTTDIILLFNVNKIKPVQLNTDMIEYVSIEGHVTELPF